jgi:hypothetical protein
LQAGLYHNNAGAIEPLGNTQEIGTITLEAPTAEQEVIAPACQ